MQELLTPIQIPSYMKYLLVYICLIVLVVFSTTPIFAQGIYNMNNDTVTDCEGTLYDSGGPDGNYSSDENLIFTICPDPTPTCIQLDFGTVDVEDFFDTINVYDGDSDTDINILFHNGGLETLPVVEATSGCITIKFESDGNGNFSGWEAAWSCFSGDCPEVDRSPTEQDCLGAIPLCLGEYSEVNAFEGEGNILDEINPEISCFTAGERNSVWYTFTVLADGDLGFTITPNELDDDYDWAVFNITNADCEDIAIDETLAVSCNYSINTGVTGATGATDETETPSGGENQNALIPVLEGETYVLNISQFSPSPNGYTINFDLSTAVIFDDESPSLESAILCGANNLQLRLPENVFCNTVSVEDFELTGPNGASFTITDISSQACIEGGEYDRLFNLVFDPAIDMAGDYILSLPGTIEDLCNNASAPGTELSFTITAADIRTPVEDLDVCVGDDLTLRIDDNVDVYNFYLDSALDSLLGTGTELDVTQYITAEDTPFFFYVTRVNDECDKTATEVSVIVRNSDVANFSYDSPICFDESAPPALPTLSADSTPGGTFTISGGATIDAATGEIDISSTIAGDTYTITYTTPNVGCGVVAMENVEIVSPPSLVIENLDDGYCEQTGEVALTTNIADAVFSGPGIAANSNVFNTALAGIDEHEICATYTDPVSGCTAQDCKFVNVFSEPTATFDAPLGACTGEEINITYSGNADINTATFMWTFSEGATPSTSDEANPTVQWDANALGIQNISLTVDIDGSCSNTEMQSIDLVEIEAMNQTTTIRPGQSLELDINASSSNGNPLEYVWSSPSDDLSCSDCPNPTVAPIVSTNYSVVISEPNSNCSVSATYQVNVIQESRIAIPKSFTPNGDGFNDDFRVAIRDFREAEMMIFSRSGNSVFKTTNPAVEGWDGTYENQNVDIGVYVYYLLVTFNNDDQRLYQGNITLIR